PTEPLLYSPLLISMIYILSRMPHLTSHFFFYSSRALRALHSFPTRRSSDLTRLTGGYSDANVYACNPFDFMRHEHDERVARIHVDRKSTRLNSSHLGISYAVFCLKKKKKKITRKRHTKTNTHEH